jgi:hypothetical protein
MRRAQRPWGSGNTTPTGEGALTPEVSPATPAPGADVPGGWPIIPREDLSRRSVVGEPTAHENWPNAPREDLSRRSVVGEPHPNENWPIVPKEDMSRRSVVGEPNANDNWPIVPREDLNRRSAVGEPSVNDNGGMPERVAERPAQGRRKGRKGKGS